MTVAGTRERGQRCDWTLRPGPLF